MAKNLITLGIGAAPGSLTYLLTGGLDIGSSVSVTTPASRIITPGAVSRVVIPEGSRVVTPEASRVSEA